MPRHKRNRANSPKSWAGRKRRELARRFKAAISARDKSIRSLAVELKVDERTLAAWYRGERLSTVATVLSVLETLESDRVEPSEAPETTQPEEPMRWYRPLQRVSQAILGR